MKLNFAICLLFLSSVLSAQQKIVRLNGSTINKTELTKKIAHIVDTGSISGLSVLIMNGGLVVYQQNFGLKNTDTKLALDAKTVLYGASFTKPVSSYLFLQLVQKNFFHLDTPLHRYLKGDIKQYDRWKTLGEDSNFHKITARHILSHGSGLPILRGFYGENLKTISDPGSKYFYSNEGFNFLGFVIESAMGEGLQALVTKYIFKPLGMKRSGMVWQQEFEGNYAVGHDSSGKVIGAEKRTSARAAGSMVTTAQDYSMFVGALLKRKSLNENLFRAMFSKQMEVKSVRGWGPLRDSFQSSLPVRHGWGLGWGIFESKFGKAFWHGGHSEGWQNYTVGFLKKGMVLILMSNSDNFQKHGEKIIKLCLGDTGAPYEWMGWK